MSDAVRSYIVAVIAAALLISLIQNIGRGAARRVCKLACALFLCMTVLQPLLRLRFEDVQDIVTYQRIEIPDAEAIQKQNRQLTDQLISEQTQAYILDKAKALGASVKAEILLQAISDYYSYPYAVQIEGAYTSAQREDLSQYIADALGIPKERQTWKNTNT